MEYRGHKYLIYNRTSNCLKAIDEPSQIAIIEVCNIANFTDPRLQVWEALTTTRDVFSHPNTCQVKRTLLYIYCFPFNITLESGTVRAPPYPFRMSICKAFEIPIMEYRPVIRKLNLTGPNELPAVDSINIGHFSIASEAINQAAWFDKIQSLQQKLERTRRLPGLRLGLTLR